MFRTGESVRDDICIKDSNVHGTPVLRYMTMANETSQLLTVTEVTKTHILIGDNLHKNFLAHFDKVEISICS